MAMYKSYGFYAAQGLLAKLNLGNMGFSQAECVIEGMEKASSGKITD